MLALGTSSCRAFILSAILSLRNFFFLIYAKEQVGFPDFKISDERIGNGDYLALRLNLEACRSGSGEENGDLLTWVSAADGGDGLRCGGWWAVGEGDLELRGLRDRGGCGSKCS
jgi:hypothetical protein